MTTIIIPKCNIWTPPSPWQRPWVPDAFPWLRNLALSVSTFPAANAAQQGQGGGGGANPTVTLDTLTILDDIDTVVASVTLEAERSGDLVVEGVTQTNEWVASGDKTATLGDDYEALLTKTSGALANPSGAPVGSWTALTSDRIWTWSSIVAFEVSWNGTLQIRETLNTSNSDTTNVSVTLEVLGGMGAIFL